LSERSSSLYAPFFNKNSIVGNEEKKLRKIREKHFMDCGKYSFYFHFLVNKMKNIVKGDF
jgi:hypothetical protein